MRLLRIAVIAAIVPLFAVPAAANTIGATDKEVQAIADPIMDSILAGMKEGDYAKFSRDFDGLMKQELDTTRFDSRRQEIQAQIGDYSSRTYLGFLNQRGMTVILWKARFTGTTDDVLLKLYLSTEGKRTVAKGLYFLSYF